MSGHAYLYIKTQREIQGFYSACNRILNATGRDNPTKDLLCLSLIEFKKVEAQQIIIRVCTEISCTLLLVLYFPKSCMRNYRALPHPIYRSNESAQVVIPYVFYCICMLKANIFHYLVSCNHRRFVSPGSTVTLSLA